MQRQLMLKVIVSTLVLMVSACSDTTSSNSSASGERVTPIAAYELAPRDLSRQLNLSATVEPRISVNLNSRTQGLVERVFVEEGDKVSAGDLLARFDVAEHRAELARAQARLDESRFELTRLETLSDTQTVSQQDVQRARVAFEVASAEVSLWQTRLGFGEIRAPQAGVVTARYIEAGEAVEPREPLFRLAAMEELVVRAGVSERDIRFLTQGQSVPLRFDALPEHDVEGTIRRIFPAADESSRLIHVEVLLPESSYQEGVRPGFLARLPLLVDPRPEVLAVPAAAVGESEHQSYVYRVVDERLERVFLELGVTRGQWTEVRAGLEVGDVILATNPIDMREGTKVRIVNWRG